MHTSKSLSLLAVALMQGLAAAAPQGVHYHMNGTITATGTSTGTSSSSSVASPIGTAPSHSFSVLVPMGTAPSHFSSVSVPMGTAPSHFSSVPVSLGTAPSHSSSVPVPMGTAPSHSFSVSVPIGTAPSHSSSVPASMGTAPSHSSWVSAPMGTAPSHSSSVPIPIGTGTSSSRSSVVPITASSSTISHGTSMVDGFTTALSTMTKTKTLTWTVMVPCTTVAAGTTSYYTTASVYTTYVSDVKTITITSACTKCAYATPTPAGPGGSVAPDTTIIKPADSTPTSSVKTIQEIKTVVPIVVSAGQTTTAPAASVPSNPTGPAKGTISVVSGSGACPAVSTVTVYNPTTIYATVTVSPGVSTPSTTVIGCSAGKCTTITNVNTKTFTNWNGTEPTATFKPTGKGFATGLTTAK